MNRRVLLAALLGLAWADATPAADAEHLRFLRPIDIPARSAEELVSVGLDAAVQAAIGAGHADLRVLDAGGREVSRVVRQGTVVSFGAVRTSFAVDPPRLRPLPSGGLEIELTIDPEKHPHPIDGFGIDTPLRNFEQRVQVQRLDDTGVWRPVGDDTLLYDYSQFMDTRQLDVAFPRQPPGGTWRITVDETTVEQRSLLSEFVRTVAGGGEKAISERTLVARQPFRIDRILAWRNDEVAALRGAAGVVHPVAAFRVEAEPKEQRTRIRVTSGREPITGFRLVVDDRNFGRSVRVEVPPSGSGAPGRAPEVLASARLHSVDLRGLRREDTVIRFPESRRTDYEIVVDDGDSPPLRIVGVEAISPTEEVVFLAAPAERYVLAYGAAEGDGRPFPRPRYDTSAIDTALAAGQVPVVGTLGAEEERRVAPREVPWAVRALENRWLVGGSIALLAVLLGVSLVGAARRVGDGPARPDGE